MLNESLEEKIINLKDKISEARDYINSDFCRKCDYIYRELQILEQQLLDLENERNRLS